MQKLETRNKKRYNKPKKLCTLIPILGISISVWLFLIVSPYSKTIKEQYYSCVLVVLVRIDFQSLIRVPIFSNLYTDGFLTQWGFHRVQEHPKRSSLLSFILILIFLPFTCSLFIYVFTIYYYIFHYSLLPIHYSLFTITYSLFNIHYYVFIIMYLLFVYVFTIHFTMLYALYIMHYALCTMHYLLFIRIYMYSLFYTYLYVFTISRDEIP